MIRAEIKKLIDNSIKALQKEKTLPDFDIPEINIEHPENEEFGDYSSNVAMVTAKLARMKPMDLAEKLKVKIENLKPSDLLEKVEVVKPGFVNLILDKRYFLGQIPGILKKKKKYGDLEIGKGQKIQVEFISANPTGPLTIGNGRGGFTGDVLVSVLNKAGYFAFREYYWNDAKDSTQVEGLGKSVKGEEEVYAGEYIKDLPNKIKKEFNKNVDDLSIEEAGQYAVSILKKDIEKFIKEKLNINFDNWFSEQSLYDNTKKDKALKLMEEEKLLYEKEKAKWFKSSEYGDTEDRVVIRSDGSPTYLLPDIAYHLDKFDRGFDKVINIWGADHGGYVARLKGAMEALGHKGKLEILIAQLVRLIKNGQEVKMSKRAGTFVTLEELIDEVGLDASRFFFLMYSLNTHMDFDMDLAKEKSDKNPVYYVQYAHARMSSIFLKAEAEGIKNISMDTKEHDPNLLSNQAELALIKELIKYPELIEDVATRYEIHRLPYYSIDLARKFHSFYNACQVINDDSELTKSRLALVRASQIVLQNVLGVMGVSAPEHM